LKIAVYNGKL